MKSGKQERYEYQVPTEIIRDVEAIKAAFGDRIDAMVYNAYMKGRRDQLELDMFHCTMELNISYSEVQNMLSPHLPENYEVTAEDVAQYRISYLTGLYMATAMSVRQLLSKTNMDVDTIMRLLEYNQDHIDFCKAAQDIDDTNLERFAYQYVSSMTKKIETKKMVWT